MDRETLIAKIARLQENMKNQAKISQLDLDLQLGYIRELYDSYLEMKYNFADTQPCRAEQPQDDKIEPPLSEDGDWSLFEDGKEPEKTVEIEEIGEVWEIEEEEEIGEMEEVFEDEEIEEFPDEEEEILDEEEEIGETEEEEEIGKTEEEEEVFDDEDVEDFPDEEEEILEEDDEVGEIEEEEEIGEIDEMEEMEKVFDDDEEEELEEVDTENNEFPIVEMDTKMAFSIPDISIETKSVSDINLDDIEFDEDNYEEEEEEEETMPQPQPSFHSGMPHSRYYDDEIEVENPIPVKSTIGESYKSERPSLNEIVSSYKPDESIGSKLQQGNVSDLMKSIDMNNKFLFVKELFRGNGSAFTEEINKLNSFNKLNEVIPYWDFIKEKYKWDTQSEACAELYRLVLRKFAK